MMDGVDQAGFPNTNIPADVYLDSIYLEGPSATGDYTFSFQATDTDGNLGDRGIVITVE
jgi:hypothetical protein